MAFADDLVIIAEESIHMQILLESCKEFFDNKGFQANAGKCASLRCVPAGKKRTLKVITEKHPKWGREDIPSITFKDLVKYLGVEIQPDGSVKLPRATWETYPKNLAAAHLNPIQKVDAIRQVMVAKIQYQLRLSDHGLEEARKINRLIRKYVKRILHLPTWTSNNWIHHRNGGNIPDLEKRTMITRLKATTKMKLLTDKAARITGDQLNPHSEQQVQRLRLPNSINIKEAVYQQMADRLKRMNNGKSLVTMLQSHHKRQWIWTKRGLTPGNKLRYIQALSGSLPTKVNKTRWIQERQTKICTRCKSREIEDDMHILTRCTFNKDLITKRHDHLVRKIAKELKKAHPNGGNIWCERSWNRIDATGNSNGQRQQSIHN